MQKQYTKGGYKKSMKNENKSNRVTEKEHLDEERKIKRVILSILGSIIALIIVIGILMLIQLFDNPENVIASTEDNLDIAPKPTEDKNIEIYQPTPSLSPALTPDQTLQNDAVNILLLGIDPDTKPRGDQHTDSITVIAINYKENKVDLISLPRDAFTHVPGIKGFYKLNAAINCGGGLNDDGFKKVCEAATWMLGGINIDYYIAFEIETAAKIGDLIGGVDIDVEMDYRGHSGRHYKKGMQHLDGTGIVDYMRLRKYATNGRRTDKDRMRRNKGTLKAIFIKMKEKNMPISEILRVADKGMYTNATPKEFFDLAQFAYESIDFDNIKSHDLPGDIRNVLNWNFYFIDQAVRKAVIKEVYGIDVPEQQFVSYEYAKWLESYGLKTIRYLAIADELKEFCMEGGENNLNKEQRSSYDLLNEAYFNVQKAYNIAALSLSQSDSNELEVANQELRNAAVALAKQIDYPGKLSWSTNVPWYDDPYINEIDVGFE